MPTINRRCDGYAPTDPNRERRDRWREMIGDCRAVLAKLPLRQWRKRQDELDRIAALERAIERT